MESATTPKRHVCLYQDSEEHYVSIQIAVLSLVEHEPDWDIHVYLTRSDGWLVDWLRGFPQVQVHPAAPALNGFNAKPHVLLDCLGRTDGEVIWFDSDMLLTRSLTPWLAQIPPAHCIAAENPPGDWPEGSDMRTRGWGFEPGRAIPKTVNSCFVRFSREHLPLAKAWVEAVTRPDYVAAQSRHWSERPAYFLGDQDALGALLGARPFACVGLTFLRDGTDIAQCFGANGFSWQNRLRSLWSEGPAIVHAQGAKPWGLDGRIPVSLDVSPYTLLSLRYRQHLHRQDWLDGRTRLGRCLRSVFGRHPFLAGLAPAGLQAGRRFAGQVRHRGRGPRLRGMDIPARRDAPSDGPTAASLAEIARSGQEQPIGKN